jgi:hypothetical protein
MPADDLDARIRAMLGDAVGAAPAPPELDSAGLPTTAAPVVGLDTARRRRWLGPAAAALTAAAAVVGLVHVTNRGTDTTVVPASDVTEPAGVAATTTVAPDSTVTTAVGTTVPDSATTTIAPDTTAVPQSTVTTMVVPDVPTGLVTSGRDGVWIVDRDGPKVQWWNEPAAFAVRSPDGSMIVQQHLRGDACTLDGICVAADSVPLRLVGPNAYPVVLWDYLPGGWLRLHDVARLLDGRVMALVEWQTTVEAGVETEPGRLYAVDVETGAAVVVIDRFGGWEEGSSRLHLAENGLIVGEYSSGVTRSFFSAVVPGGAPLATEPLPPAVLPHPAGFDDCGDCPGLYAIDRTGTVLAWIDGDDLVIRSLATGTQRRVALEGRGAGASDIDIALQVEGDLGGPLLVAVEHRWSYDERPAMVFEVGDAGITELPVGAPASVSL